jgi:hypothetical protein
MASDITRHKLAQNLRCGLVSRPASVEELIAQIALHTNAETNVLHGA